MRNTKIALVALLAITGIVFAKTMIHPKNNKSIPAKQQFTRAAPGTHRASIPPKEISYDSTLQLVQQLRTATSNNRAKAGQIFTNILNEQLVPYWIGTPWDFNGVTQQPGKGQIACGYFITTLLRDAGVQLNRVKLAQCASGKIISSLVQPAYHKNYSSLSFEDFITEIKKKGTGVLIVGLDFHTGFLLNDGAELYFIHSNYIGRQGVVKEVAAQSRALRASKWRSTGWLTGDPRFLEKWMNKQPF